LRDMNLKLRVKVTERYKLSIQTFFIAIASLYLTILKEKLNHEYTVFSPQHITWRPLQSLG